jgi:site-specific recombinase XerD
MTSSSRRRADWITIRAYGDDVAAFRRFTGKPLRATDLSDLQRYADSLVGAPASRGRRLKTLKSLLSFATRMGYLPFNAGAAIRGPAQEQKLAERILCDTLGHASIATTSRYLHARPDKSSGDYLTILPSDE